MPFHSGIRQDEVPRAPEALNITVLPDILEALEGDEERRAQGALWLASLVDEASGPAALVLGEYIRESGALELLAALFGAWMHLEPQVLRLLLMAGSSAPPLAETGWAARPMREASGERCHISW